MIVINKYILLFTVLLLANFVVADTPDFAAEFNDMTKKFLTQMGLF